MAAKTTPASRSRLATSFGESTRKTKKNSPTLPTRAGNGGQYRSQRAPVEGRPKAADRGRGGHPETHHPEQRHASDQARVQSLGRSLPGHVPHFMEGVLQDLADPERSPEEPQHADDERNQAAVERMPTCDFSLVPDHRELAEAPRFPSRRLGRRVMRQDVAHDRVEDQKERQDRQKAVVGDQGGQLASSVVAVFLDDAEDKGGQPVLLLEPVQLANGRLEYSRLCSYPAYGSVDAPVVPSQGCCWRSASPLSSQCCMRRRRCCSIVRQSRRNNISRCASGLLTRLVTKPLWLAGIAADGLAFVFQFVALGHGSLILVQPLLVSGLLFALPLGAWFAKAHLTAQRLGRGCCCGGGAEPLSGRRQPGPGPHGGLRAAPGWFSASSVSP